jgi:MFS transporter, ACS family, aldohexuronate transporter
VTRGGALSLVTLAHGLGSLSILAVAPLSPFLLEGFGLSRVQVGLFLPAAYLGGMIFALPAGWLTERRGVRWPLVLGQALTGALVVLASLAPDLPLALTCLFVGGLGFGVLNPTTGKAIIDWFPPHERGRAMGVKQTGLTLGGIVSAAALPPMAVAFGWRVALATAGGVSLLSALVVALLYRDPPSRSAASSSSPARFSDLVPFLTRPGVVVIFLCGLALSLLQSGVLAYFVLSVRDTFALSAVDAGRLLALAHLGGAAGRLGWGVVSDRVFGGRRRPGLTINALIGAAAFACLALGARLPLGLLPMLAIVLGIAAFGWVGLYFALVAEIGGAQSAGLLTGLAVIFAWGGILVGPPLLGVLLDLTDSYRSAWLALSVTAVAVAVTLPRLRPLVQRDPVAQRAA